MSDTPKRRILFVEKDPSYLDELKKMLGALSGYWDMFFIATGSEVGLACDAAEKLAAENTQARVVSLPCLELFLEQPREYQRALVPDDGTPVFAVEAGRGESLRRLVGSRGQVYGIDRFGASAPYADLAEFFGFTPDRLSASVRSHLRELGD